MDIANWLHTQGFTPDSLPHSYLVLDTETTGLSPENDLITEIGLVDVFECGTTEDSVISQGIVLDWTREPSLDQTWLAQRLESTRFAMAERGRVFHQTYDYLHNHPKRIMPREGLAATRDWILDVRSRNEHLLGHNSWAFDVNFFECSFSRWLGDKFKFLPNEMYDTGTMEKASQLGTAWRPGETLQHFSQYVGSLRRRVKWSLSDHCVPKYDLANRYKLETDKAHTADYDAYVTHLLFEEFRRLLREREQSAVTQGDLCGSSA